MNNRTRDDSGRFTEELTEQGILKAFDASDDAFLTAPEIAELFGVTRQAVTNRLKQMEADGLVESKQAGANAVGWWATVAPRLSAEAERQAKEAERENAVSQEEMKRRLGMDG
ncbi:MarR family protein [Halogranum amylolyticum]|uniref:MarR family protein n=1 Tax=Halogranum amylolyticum TaxID=660520 RepID=A0A1H8WTB6_9EURY|nr:MarR family transcriptional regulator [Halogranum amylolyticum]SEP30930.1 MarR family protein [Halogranum amylolyticum]